MRSSIRNRQSSFICTWNTLASAVWNSLTCRYYSAHGFFKTGPRPFLIQESDTQTRRSAIGMPDELMFVHEPIQPRKIAQRFAISHPSAGFCKMEAFPILQFGSDNFFVTIAIPCRYSLLSCCKLCFRHCGNVFTKQIVENVHGADSKI